MPSTSHAHRIDTLIADASAACSRNSCFEAERRAAEALNLAYQASDYERMMRIIPTLKEARRQRLQQALDTGQVTVIDSPIAEGTKIEAGCYLVQPPQVGADARRLRLQAMQEEVPVLVVCREPLTRLKLCPIVAISPGATVRTMVDPPDDPPQQSWIVETLEELGSFAIESVDAALAPERRVTTLYERLETVPDHQGLHDALIAACAGAQQDA